MTGLDDVKVCYQIILAKWVHFVRVMWWERGFYETFHTFRFFYFDLDIKLTGNISSIFYGMKIHWWIVSKYIGRLRTVFPKRLFQNIIESCLSF